MSDVFCAVVCGADPIARCGRLQQSQSDAGKQHSGAVSCFMETALSNAKLRLLQLLEQQLEEMRSTYQLNQEVGQCKQLQLRCVVAQTHMLAD